MRPPFRAPIYPDFGDVSAPSSFGARRHTNPARGIPGLLRSLGILSPLLLFGCAAPGPEDIAAGKEHYLTAKNACISHLPNSLTEQADCLTAAADRYRRPTYRYGDLMTRAQQQRRALAVRADRHEISRRQYDRAIARSEAAISREEDRRNAEDATEARDDTVFGRMFGSVARLFQ